MLNLIRSISLLTCVCFAAPAAAQQALIPPPGQPATPAAPTAPAAQPPGPPKPITETTVSDSREGSNNQKDWHFIGHVEMDRDPQGISKIFADDVRVSTDENHAIATGNVL